MERDANQSEDGAITNGQEGLSRALAVALVLLVAATIAISAPSGSSVFAEDSPSYCEITDVHVNSVTPTDYSSTYVQVTVSFSVSCSGGNDGTVWDIRTNVYAESNLLGVTPLSTSDKQYAFGQGTVQYVVNSQIDAMSYYGYGEQTPSFYVKITAINTSTGSLDAQEQVPFAVDTSQYPFDLTQSNYCHFPGLSQFFQLLPGCGASNNATTSATTPPNCNSYGLPQFFQQYLPGCSGTTSQPTITNQSSAQQVPVQEPVNSLPQPNTSPSLSANTPSLSYRTVEAISGIVIAAILALVGTVLVMSRLGRLRVSRYVVLVRSQVKFCTACGLQLEPSANFCARCGKSCPIGQLS